MKDKIDLTIKPTMGCNMKCKHCFNGDAFVPTDMLDVNTALELVRKACKEYKKSKNCISWWRTVFGWNKFL